MAESPSNFSQWTQPEPEYDYGGWQRAQPVHKQQAPSDHAFIFNHQTWPQLPPPPNYDWLV